MNLRKEIQRILINEAIRDFDDPATRHEDGSLMYQDGTTPGWVESSHNFKNNLSQAVRWLWLQKQIPNPPAKSRPKLENIREADVHMKPMFMPEDKKWKAVPKYVQGALTGFQYMQWKIFELDRHRGTLFSDGLLGFFRPQEDGGRKWELITDRKFNDNPLAAMRYIYLQRRKSNL